MMRQVSASPPQGMPYMMPLAQKPPYCGRYFCGAASNSALCAALAKWKVTPWNWLLNCGWPLAWRFSVK